MFLRPRADAFCGALQSWVPIRPAARIRDRGKALAACAKIASNKQLEIDATEIRIPAEHRLGQMLTDQK